ncbi:retrotransposon protein, putative, ty1-copia subclass [Tanacetum coccineum]
MKVQRLKGQVLRTKQVVPYQPKAKPNPLREENPNKDQACHHCHVAGHWKRNCPLYIEELRANKKKSEPGAAVSGIYRRKERTILSGINICNKDDHMDTLPWKHREILVEPRKSGVRQSELIPVRDLGELAIIKLPCLTLNKVIRQGAMDEEMNSMKVNEVWTEVDPLPNAKIVRSKWIFTKKTDMDGKVQPIKSSGFLYAIDSVTMIMRSWPNGCLKLLLDGRLDEDIYMEANWKVFIPMEVKHDLSNEMCASSDEEKAYMKKVPYASAVGSIIYAVRCTRPDVAFLLKNLAVISTESGKALLGLLVKHILKYLRNTKDMFLVYGGNPDTELEVTGFCDASWQCDKDDTKSQTGYVLSYLEKQ